MEGDPGQAENSDHSETRPGLRTPVIVLIALLVGAGIATGAWLLFGRNEDTNSNPSVASTGVGPSTSPSSHSITGSLAANQCGGLTAITNATVEVRDENDTLVGSGTTGGDEGSHSGYPCSVSFTIADVPKANFYQVRIGSHDGPNYSYAEMESMGWSLDLSLGKAKDAGSGQPSTYRVTYRVSGASSAGTITYQNRGNGTSQKSNAALPWTTHLTMKRGDFYYVSAQNNGGGAIVCDVYINGHRVKSSRSTGLYSICDASGNVH